MSNIPNETITIRINDCTWITNDIKRSIRKKNRHHTRAERSKSVLDWERFRHIRNECTSKIRNAKITYFDKLSGKLHDDRTSTKDWCTIAKQISNFKNKKEITSISERLWMTERNFELFSAMLARHSIKFGIVDFCIN